MSTNPLNVEGRINQGYHRTSLQDGDLSAGGFLLDSGGAHDHDLRGKGKRKAIDIESAASGRMDGRSFSSMSSKRKSRVSSRQSYHTPTKTSPRTTYGQSEMQGLLPSIDAAQIVSMALSLSESRRMSLTAGRLPSPGTPSPRQLLHASSPLSGTAVFPEQSRGSMSNIVQLQRRTSRNISPSPGGQDSDLFGQHISNATFLRAQKARSYIELSSEYRRLLQVLPPLKPRSSQQRNRSTSSPTQTKGLTQYATPPQGATVPQNSLGRTYNPLQYIRNRKIRLRERQGLDGEAEGWDDVTRVNAWVDSVEDKSEHPSYLLEEVAMLPEWVIPIHGEPKRNSSQQGSSKDGSQRRQSMRPSRPKYDWLISPVDLLADAHWLEQGNHKGQIEDYRGSKLFPKFKAPEHPLPSIPSPEISYEIQENLNQQDVNSPESPALNGHEARPAIQDRGPQQSASQRTKGKMSRATRNLLRRRRVSSGSSSNHSDSDPENVIPSYLGPGDPRRSLENVGPLARHMKSILEAESRNHSDDAMNRSSSDHWDRQKDSSKASDLRHNRDRLRNLQDRGSISGESALTPSQPGTPRISVEFYGNGNDNHSFTSLPHSNNGPLSSNSHRDLPPFSKSKSHRLDFLRKGKSKEKNLIEENDFALENQTNIQEPSGSEQFENSTDKWYKNDKASSVEASKVSLISSLHRKKDKSSVSHGNDLKSSKSDHSNSLLFRSGRLGELAREEKPLNDFIWRRRATNDESRSSSGSRHRFHSSEDDSSNLAPDEVRKPSGRTTVNRPLARELRSYSASDLNQAQYHFTNLPAFRSSTADTNDTSESKGAHNIMSTQERLGKVESRQSRFDQLAPSALDLSDVSPHTSTLNLTREETSTTSDLPSLEHERTYGFPAGSNASSRSTSAVRSSGARLNDVLSIPGGVGVGGLPKTGLSGVDTRRNAVSREMGNLRSWSIADGSIAMVVQQPTSVTPKELEYVRAMLMSSGVKARNLVKRSYLPRDKMSTFLLKASETSGQPLPGQPVARNKEHVLAARLLSKTLESSVPEFDQAADRFRGQTCLHLHESIDELSYKINLKLTPRVQSCGDNADEFIARLTTEHTMSVTQVNDSIDLMIRNRRRRLRLFSKLGFAFLEWLLVGIMWGIWLIVMFVHVFKSIFVGGFKTIRWLLWL